jgi:hypothetical protein
VRKPGSGRSPIHCTAVAGQPSLGPDTDGENCNVFIEGTVIRGNSAREGGGGIFFVVDNNHGTLTIKNSTLHNNPSGEFFTAGFPGIFFHSSGSPIVTDSTIN